MATAPPLSFPVRRLPSDCRDWWDAPDDHAEFRARCETTERRQTARAEMLSAAWRKDLNRAARA